MKYSIERLSFEELSSFLQLQAEDAFPDLKDEQRLNLLAEKWSANAEICTCRDDREVLVGMIAFYANRPEQGIAYVPHVYVDNEHRGRKIFTSMLHIVEAYLKDKGFHYVRLEVKKDNETAQKAYINYGFTTLDEELDYSYYMQYKISKL